MLKSLIQLCVFPEENVEDDVAENVEDVGENVEDVVENVEDAVAADVDVEEEDEVNDDGDDEDSIPDDELLLALFENCNLLKLSGPQTVSTVVPIFHFSGNLVVL